jgi:F-type H+-transporting ATPase subunit epsilon
VRGNKTQRYYIDGGFAQVRNDVVTVLTSKAIPAEEIKVEEAAHALTIARQLAATPDALEAQLKAQERARAQLRIARLIHEKGEPLH